MKNFIIALTILFLFSLPAFSATLEIDLQDVEADFFQCYKMDFENPYDFNGDPFYTGQSSILTIVVPEDRFTAVRCRGQNWGPYDLQGVRTSVPGPFADEYVYQPNPPDAPNKPNIVVRILLAFLDFLFESSDGYSDV